VASGFRDNSLRAHNVGFVERTCAGALLGAARMLCFQLERSRCRLW
jgi:hypothetical protein